MKRDHEESPGGNQTPNHTFDIYEDKPYKFSRILAKKQTINGNWLYRISFLGLDDIFNKWLSYNDLLVTVANKYIKIRKTNRSAEKI